MFGNLPAEDNSLYEATLGCFWVENVLNKKNSNLLRRALLLLMVRWWNMIEKRATRKKNVSTPISLTEGFYFFKWTFTRNRNTIQPRDHQTAFSFQLTLLHLSVFLSCALPPSSFCTRLYLPCMLGWSIRHLWFFFFSHSYCCLLALLVSPSTHTVSHTQTASLPPSSSSPQPLQWS